MFFFLIFSIRPQLYFAHHYFRSPIWNWQRLNAWVEKKIFSNKPNQIALKSNLNKQESCFFSIFWILPQRYFAQRYFDSPNSNCQCHKVGIEKIRFSNNSKLTALKPNLNKHEFCFFSTFSIRPQRYSTKHQFVSPDRKWHSSTIWIEQKFIFKLNLNKLHWNLT